MGEKADRSGVKQIVIAVAAVIAACILVNIVFKGKFLTVNNISAILAMSIIACFPSWASSTSRIS